MQSLVDAFGKWQLRRRCLTSSSYVNTKLNLADAFSRFSADELATVLGVCWVSPVFPAWKMTRCCVGSGVAVCESCWGFWYGGCDGVFVCEVVPFGMCPLSADLSQFKSGFVFFGIFLSSSNLEVAVVILTATPLQVPSSRSEGGAEVSGVWCGMGGVEVSVRSLGVGVVGVWVQVQLGFDW